MPEPTRPTGPTGPMTPDQALREVKSRSRSLRVLLDHIGVQKFKEERPVLEPIKVPVDFSATLETATFLYRMVKNDRERTAFLRDPAQALIKAGLPEEAGNTAVIVQLVKDLVARATRPSPGDVFDSYTSKESKTHQQHNFDSSGRSSETTKGSIVGENTKFDGFGIVEEIFANPQFGKTFFPNQPLVTPALMIEIRNRLGSKLRG